MDARFTVKHVIADFVLQTSWMALGKDDKTGWALPLLAHCLVHLAVAMAVIWIIAPRFWFLAFVDFVIHITVDRAKGLCSSTFDVTQDHPWFWTLIGVTGPAPSDRISACRSSWRRTADWAGRSATPIELRDRNDGTAAHEEDRRCARRPDRLS